MAIEWKLARVATGEEKTLTQWRIEDANREIVNQGRDTLKLDFGGSDLLGNSPFENREVLRLDRVVDGIATTRFRGPVVNEKRGAYGSAEGFTVEVAGPWWYLENLIYMQPAAFATSATLNPVPVPPATELMTADFSTVEKTSSSIVLKEDEFGSTIDSREQILAALNYAIEKGAPIAIGEIDPGIAIPRDAIQDSTCAEVILKSLRWTPDQTLFFDYSVDPPTINARSRANRDALEIDLADETVSEVEINPRRDLAVPGVTINYLRRHQRTNIEFETLDKDAAGPDPEGIGALVMTLELYGSYIVPDVDPAVTTPFVVAAEPVPAGLAESLYNEYSIIPYEGRLLIVQEECEALDWTNRKLSIASGVPVWQTAEMLIQQSSENIFAGRTELTVGPPRQLGAQDLLGLVRKGRTKAPAITDRSPVVPTPPNPNFPNPTSRDPQISFSPWNKPDLILYVWRGENVGGPGWYGVYTHDVAKVYDVQGGIGHAINGGSMNIGDVVLFHGARIGRGQDKRIAVGGVMAPHNTALMTPGGTVLPDYEVDAWTRPVVVH